MEKNLIEELKRIKAEQGMDFCPINKLDVKNNENKIYLVKMNGHEICTHPYYLSRTIAELK